MNKCIAGFNTLRIVYLSSKHCNVCTVRSLHSHLIYYRQNYREILQNFTYINARKMAQKSITSFFKITPKKSEDAQGRPPKDESFSNEDLQSKGSSDSNSNKKRAKRLRSDSEEPASPKVANGSSSPVTSIKKKKTKRQRIESSGSEAGSPVNAPESSPETVTTVKIEQNTPKTYQSPKTKKAKANKKFKEELASPETKENVAKNKKKSSSPKSDKTKEEKTTEGKKKTSPKRNSKSNSVLSEEQIKQDNTSSEENEIVGNKNNKNVKSPSPVVKEEKASPPKKKNVFELMTGKATTKANGIKTEAEKDEKAEALTEEADYNPGKAKYHPVSDACWARGAPVPYLALARTLQAIEGTSARLRMVELLANYLRSVIALSPDDLLPSIYLCLNQLAPAYHSIELGIAETYLMKAVGACTGRTLAQLRAAARRGGDLGAVAEGARAAQRTMFAPPPLTARKVFASLKEIALMTGQASVNKKIAKIQSLYVACRHSEARYLIRSLEGKLRIGLAEQSLLQALALAAAATPPAGERAGELDVAAALGADKFKARVDEFALIIKTTYCECPNYELLVPVLLREGVEALPKHCRLTPGIPLKPMLAHPTKGVLEVFNRFEKERFTCEYKYDGERAQIHVPARADGAGPDLARAAVFSRSQEDNTSKYPDVLGRLDALLGEGVTSCVLDCEAVAYDPAAKQILPFQVLSTRKRKDASAATISVQVCVFVFDLLLLNGRALVREPLLERRRLLRDHMREADGIWQFAVHRDCSSSEEVQQFLEESVRDCCEGLMVKTLLGENARYDIARRSRNWLKLKKDYLEGVGDSVDAVVIGGYWGRGKRSGAFGGFLLACHDRDNDEYQSLCKIGTGFSDEDLKTLSEALQQHVISAPPNYYRYDSSHAPDAWFAAACVWEVRCADLSLSPAHRAAAGLAHRDKGVSLRFPRFIRVRPDKGPEQATSAQQIAELYLAQDQVRAQPAPRRDEEDFY